MKAIFKKVTATNHPRYNANTKGWEFIDLARDEDDFCALFNVVSDRETFFDMKQSEKGTYYMDESGNEVYDPNYPDRWDFTDYQYFIIDMSTLDEWNDSDKIDAIKECPYAFEEVKEVIGL